MDNGKKDCVMVKDYTHMQIRMSIQDNGQRARSTDKEHMYLMIQQ